MSQVFHGRYDENGLSIGDVVEFTADGGIFNQYPVGARRTLQESSMGYPRLMDDRNQNGLSASYIVVSSANKRKRGGFAQFMEKHNL